MLGTLVGTFTYEAMYLVAAGLVFAAGVLYFLVHGRFVRRRV